MKKIISIIMGIVALLSVFLCACSKNVPQDISTGYVKMTTCGYSCDMVYDMYDVNKEYYNMGVSTQLIVIDMETYEGLLVYWCIDEASAKEFEKRVYEDFKTEEVKVVGNVVYFGSKKLIKDFEK